MSHFYITSEANEDTLDSADTLQDAIVIARELAKGSQAGDPVCIEHDGKNVRQFVLLPNGKVDEQAFA